jgi:hypothetical protein
MSTITSRARQLLYLAAVLMGAVFVLVYRGLLWPIVRGYGGDWLIVQFIYMIGRLWIGFRWRYRLAACVMLVGILAEVIQLLGAGVIPHTFAAEVTIGSTFDAIDIIAYALGLASVLAVDEAGFLHRI